MAEEKKSTAPAKAEHTAVKKVENPEKLGFFASAKKWLRELKSELKKVVWSTPQQVLKNALIVVGCVIVVGIFIWLFDFVAQAVITGLINLFK
jgi:preprotein translocase subunit SecE